MERRDEAPARRPSAAPPAREHRQLHAGQPGATRPKINPNRYHEERAASRAGREKASIVFVRQEGPPEGMAWPQTAPVQRARRHAALRAHRTRALEERRRVRTTAAVRLGVHRRAALPARALRARLLLP